MFSTNEPVLAELQGFPVDVFIPYDYGVQAAANALFTTTSFRQDHPEVVCGWFGRWPGAGNTRSTTQKKQ